MLLHQKNTVCLGYVSSYSMREKIPKQIAFLNRDLCMLSFGPTELIVLKLPCDLF